MTKASANSEFFDLETIYANDIPTEKALRAAALQQSSAQRTRSRRNFRRAKSTALLAELLPATIPPGEAWHVLSSGDVDAMSYLDHVVQGKRLYHALFSTWCMAMPDVQRFAELIAAGQIARLEAYVGEIFPNQYPAEYEALKATVRPTGGRVCVFRNHSKVILAGSRTQSMVIESSANLNTNPRTENTILTHDAGLYRHHKAYFDRVRSFARDFDDWQPLIWPGTA